MTKLSDEQLAYECQYAQNNGAHLECKIDLILEGIRRLLLRNTDDDPFCERDED